MAKLKEFLKRHSFLLIIIIALLVAGTNYLVYPVLIKKQLNLVQVPVASRQLDQSTIIDDTCLTTISVDPSFLPKNVVLNKDEIKDKYVAQGYTIPKDGFIYKEAITDAATAFGKSFANLKDGEYAYTIYLKDDNSQYGKTGVMQVGQYVNIYYYEEYRNEAEQKVYLTGMLAENVRILDVGLLNNTQTYIVLALSEDQIADFVLAEQYGDVVPLVSFQSNGIEFEASTYYDKYSLIDHLRQKSTVMQVPEIEIEVEPESEPLPPQVPEIVEEQGVVEE